MEVTEAEDVDCVEDDMIGGGGMGVVDFGGVVGWTNSVKPVADIMWRDEWWKEKVVKSRRELEERKRMRFFCVVAHSFIFFLSLFLFVDLLL